MGWLETKAIFTFSAIFWCLICVCDGVGKSTQDVEQVIERSQYIQHGLENTEPVLYGGNEVTGRRRIISHHRQKRGGSNKGKSKNSGGGIWKKISRGIQKFTNHIRKTKQKIIRLIKGPTYSKPHRKWNSKGADSSSLKFNASATATLTKGKGQIAGI